MTGPGEENEGKLGYARRDVRPGEVMREVASPYHCRPLLAMAGTDVSVARSSTGLGARHGLSRTWSTSTSRRRMRYCPPLLCYACAVKCPVLATDVLCGFRLRHYQAAKQLLRTIASKIVE
eukprot:450141-Rhodomonas_salina.1